MPFPGFTASSPLDPPHEFDPFPKTPDLCRACGSHRGNHPKETMIHAPNGGTLYVGICRDCVEVDTRRENTGERSKFGPSALLTFDQARELRDWLVSNLPNQ